MFACVNTFGVDIQELTKRLTDTFSSSDDFKCRPLRVGKKNCLFAYLDGNIDKTLLEQDVVRPLKTRTILKVPISKHCKTRCRTAMR